MWWYYLVVIFCDVFLSNADYEVPDAIDGVLSPKGFQASIPDLDPVISSPRAKVDTTNISTRQQETPNNDPTECIPSLTRYNGGLKVCKGELIFNEDFDAGWRKDYWSREHKFADAPDYEFVVYLQSPETATVSQNILKIYPRTTESELGPEFLTKSLDLSMRCTGVLGSRECFHKNDSVFILPPVISTQLSSKGKFAFKFGKIEIRAKLPKGDWIYPELYLNSQNEEYGPNFESGQMRIAFLNGNETKSKTLFGGIVLGDNPAARSYGLKYIEKLSSWSDEFHNFSLTWKPDRIIVSVNRVVYGVIRSPVNGFSSLWQRLDIPYAKRWQSGSLRPFDKEMYLTLGVGVGGLSFDDEPDKPWINNERLSLKKFFKAKNQWMPTWNEESQLEIDYVKIWAL